MLIQLSTSVFICGQFLMSVISNSASADILLSCFGLCYEWIYVSVSLSCSVSYFMARRMDNFRIMASTVMLLLVVIFVKSP